MRRVALGNLYAGDWKRVVENALREIERASFIGDVGGLEATLTKPSTDGILFYDVSRKTFAFLALSGLAITDDTLALSGPVHLPSMTVAEAVDAAATASAGDMIYVTDETGGAVPAFFDGSDWLRCTDRTVISA